MKIRRVENSQLPITCYPDPKRGGVLLPGSIVEIDQMIQCPEHAFMVIMKTNRYFCPTIHENQLYALSRKINMPIFRYGETFFAFTPDFEVVDEN